MANGKQALLNCQGKVDAANCLEVYGVAQVGSAGPATTLGTKVCQVDSSNRLLVVFK